MQVQRNQLRAKTSKGQKPGCRNKQTEPQFHAECIPDSLLVSASIILRRKNTCAGYAAENTEIENQDQLIDDGHAGHLFCADLPHHNIV